jgi:hypothetical protein
MYTTSISRWATSRRGIEADCLLVGGLLLAITTSVHVMVFPDPVATEAIELFVAVGLSLVLIYGGYWLRTSDVDVEVVRSLARSTVAGAVATGLAFAWFLVHQWLAGGVDEPVFVILSSASGGAAVGFVAGARNVGTLDSGPASEGARVQTDGERRLLGSRRNRTSTRGGTAGVP